MNSALTYILLLKLKNKIKAIVKSPIKLIFTVVIIALMGITLFSGNMKASGSGNELRDIKELYCMVLVLFSMMFVLQAATGFSNGASMFSMADVNLIFTGPYKPYKVLFYGLVRQLGTSLLVSIFILFQYSTLHRIYGAGFDALLIIFVGYALTVFLGQLTAVVIYSYTSSSDAKKRVVKVIFYGMLLCFGAYAALSLLKGEVTLAAAINVLSAPVFKTLPVAGWISNAVEGALSGNIMQIFVGLGAGAIYTVLLLIFMIYYNTDFYEDVLRSTEISFSAITAAKEGKMRENAPVNVRVGKTGIGNGSGAKVIYYKHMVENRRACFFMIDKMTLIFSVSSLVFSLFMKKVGIIAVFAFSVYMQIFSVSLGRFIKELTKPYIYLIPESPVKKMIYAIMESLPKYVTNAILIYIPVSFVLDLSPTDTLFVILAHISFSILFTAGNVVVERLWTGGSSVGLALLFYFVVIVVLVLPGVVLSILMAIFSPAIPVISSIPKNSLIMLSFIVCNIPVSLLSFYLCRNMLQYAELNSKT